MLRVLQGWNKIDYVDCGFVKIISFIVTLNCIPTLTPLQNEQKYWDKRMLDHFDPPSMLHQSRQTHLMTYAAIKSFSRNQSSLRTSNTAKVSAVWKNFVAELLLGRCRFSRHQGAWIG